MSQDEEGSSESRSKEHDEHGCQLVSVLDGEWQVLQKKNSENQSSFAWKCCIIENRLFEADAYLSGNSTVRVVTHEVGQSRAGQVQRAVQHFSGVFWIFLKQTSIWVDAS